MWLIPLYLIGGNKFCINAVSNDIKSCSPGWKRKRKRNNNSIAEYHGNTE